MKWYKLFFNNINLIGVYLYDYLKIDIIFIFNLFKLLLEFIEVFNVLNGGVFE